MDITTVVDDVIQWMRKQRELDQLPAELIDAQTDVITEGIFDSMKLLQLINYLEETYGITISVEFMLPANLSTPQGIAEMVVKLSTSC
jgi:acyl carrier protein